MAAEMAGDVAALVKDATPYLTSALGAYGGAVLAKVRDDSADETVSLGRRLLQKVFGHKKDGEPLPTVLAEVIGNLGDEDYLGVLRATIRKSLQDNAQLLAEVREILKEARPAVTAGPQTARAGDGGTAQNVVAGGNVFAPIIRSGRDTYAASGDATIYRTES